MQTVLFTHTFNHLNPIEISYYEFGLEEWENEEKKILFVHKFHTMNVWIARQQQKKIPNKYLYK